MRFRRGDRVKIDWDAIAEEEKDKIRQYHISEGIVRSFYYYQNMCSVMLPNGSIYYINADILINLSKRPAEFIEKLFDSILI